MQDNREYTDKINFDGIVALCEDKARDMEPWPNYFKLRAGEMESLLSIYRPNGRGAALDMGSGLGFNALVLKKIYGRVVASDLYSRDVITHTLGMDRSMDFFRKVGAGGIETVSSRCEAMPFKDGSFDAVYMIYTLEHIKDRIGALEEAGRVLKPGGELVVIVPNFLERLFYPLSFYRDITRRAAAYLRKRKDGGTGGGGVKNIPDKRASSYPHFPMPEPHGEYADYCSELMKTNTFQWIALAKKSGLKVKSAFTTMLFPKELSSFVLGEKALDCYLKTRRVNNILGKFPVLRSLGQNLCLVLENDHCRPHLRGEERLTLNLTS